MKKIILLNLLFIIISNLYSIESDKKKWVIAFSDLKGENLSLNNQFLISTLPTYLKENATKDFKHFLTDNEVEGVYRNFISKKIDELDKKRLSTIQSRDNLLFNGKDTDEYKKREDELTKIQEDIDEFKETDLSKLDKIESLDIEYREDLELPNGNHIKKLLEKNGIDFLFTGHLEEEAGNLFLNLYLYSIYEDDKIVIYTGIGNSEDILEQRPEMVNSVNQKIVSKELIDYEISVLPTESLIYVNSVFKGIGVYKGYSFPGDKIEFKLLKDGYETVVSSHEVTENNKAFNFELLETELDMVNITSNPEGAKVHYGSKFMGLTPIDIPLLSNPQKLTLSLEGYMDKSVAINLNTKDMHFELDSNIIDVDENFAKHKNNFYLSVGIFSISLAVPLFLTSQSDMIGTYNENIDLYTNISAINATIWGIHLFYRLYRYLEAAKLSVE